MTKNIKLMVAFGLALMVSACASPHNPELDLFLKNAVEELRGKTAEDIIACAGLPDATVDLKEEKQVLTYSNVTTRFERDPLYGHRHHGCSAYTHNYYCSAYDHTFLGHHDWIDVVQKGCRVGVWMKDAKVEEISFEVTSERAKGHCARILKSCLMPPERQSERQTDAAAASEGAKPPKSDENL